MNNKWTASMIHRATRLSERRIQDLRQRLLAIDLDSRHDERMTAKECKSCFYLDAGKMSGQAMTLCRCDNCGERFTHPNTNVPKLCPLCPASLGVCRRCGGAQD